MSRISGGRLYQKYNAARMIDENDNLTPLGWVALRQWLREMYSHLGILSFYEEDD